MKAAEFSEFSYGFALTNEIVAWAPLTIAPVFPSLIEEGETGGGWDLKLDMPGVPLYLQFKRSFRVTGAAAKEIKKHKKPLNRPFHRFYVTDSDTSAQHVMLLSLDDGKSDVFYVAPRFDRLSEINNAWVAKEVAARSIFVTPQSIGELDAGSHHVSFDAFRTFVFSEPRQIDCLTAAQVVERLKARLKEDSRPLRSSAIELLSETNSAIERAQTVLAERRSGRGGPRGIPQVDLFDGPDASPSLERVRLREPSPLSEPKEALRELADRVYQKVGLQLIIAQDLVG